MFSKIKEMIFPVSEKLDSLYERDERFSSAVAPGTIAFEPGYIEIDDIYRKAYGIRDFSTLNYPRWGSTIFTQPRTITTICVEPSDNEAIRAQADNTDARAGVALMQGASASKNIEHQVERDHARTMLQMLTDEKKVFVNTAFYIQTDDEDKEELFRNYKAVCNKVKPQGVTLFPCVRAQEEAYRVASPLSPFYTSNTPADLEYLPKQFKIDMPVDTLAAIMPFSKNGMIDAEGTDLGTDKSGALIRVDMTKTSLEKANNHIAMTGMSGKGKSRTLKKIGLSEYAKKDARVIAIDVERELVYTCKKVGGQYYNAGGGHAKLSPFQPRAINFNYEDIGALEDEDAVVDVLRSTINFLHGFYQIAFDVTTRELPYLNEGLEEAYRRHGLTYETPADKVNFNDYPGPEEIAQIFSELADNAKREEQARIYDYLAMQTKTCCKGSLNGSIWGHKTNVHLDSDFIVFDIHSLIGGNVSEHAKNAQLYSILTYIWGEICRSRITGRFLRLIIDEGHMLFGTKTDVNEDTRSVPISAKFVSMMHRRARKYNVGILFATQKVNDMAGEAVRNEGEIILSGSQYQFVFGTQAKDLQATLDLCHIDEAFEDALLGFGRGECIFKSGNDKTYLQIEDTESEHAWIGTSGGR